MKRGRIRAGEVMEVAVTRLPAWDSATHERVTANTMSFLDKT
jgi:hypothetical protein